VSAPQPPRTETRQYLSNYAYTADATNMGTHGWRVTALRRLPDNTILATYTYGPAPATVPLNPLDPPSGPGAPPPGASPIPSFTASPPYQPTQRPIWPIQPFPSTAGSAVVRRNDRIVLGVIAGVVIFCCVAAAIAGSLSPVSSSASNTSQVATASAENASATGAAAASATSAQATQAVMSSTEAAFYATATADAQKNPLPPVSVLVSGARLGGQLAAFETTYGNESSQDTWDTTIAGQQVQLTVTITQFGESLDGQDRVLLVDIVGQSGSGWSATTDAAIVASFLPRDATHVRTGAGYGSLGPDHIYKSRQLANSLDASVFQNSANQQLTPGTFDWQCSTDRPMCEVGVGANS
jgi:hypothetical protein